MNYRLNPSALRRLLAALGTALVALAALAVCLWFDNALNRGITRSPANTQPIPWAGVPRGAVNSFNLHLEPDPAVISRTFQLAHDLGARYVRMQMPWEDIEIDAKGDFGDRRHDLNGDGQVDEIDSWAKYDRIVDTARAFEIELVLRLDRPPLWARAQAAATPAFQEGFAADGNSTGPPDRYQDYADFVAEVARRYQGRVRFLQLWNEPNLKVEWNWQQPSPSDFVRLMRLAADAARAANPEAVILFPSLAPTDGRDASAPISDLDFLAGVYAAGGADTFDIMSAQLYGLGQPPAEHRYVYWRGELSRPLDTRIDVSRIVLLREVMLAHGDGQKAVWIGEFGWNSAPDSIPPERRNVWGEPVSEEQKGRYIVDLMERARHEWPWVGAMSIWMLRFGGATPPNPEDPTPYFALTDRNFQPTPAYEIVRTYLSQPAIAGPGTHAWNHPAVEAIPGGWRLRFEGQRLELNGSAGVYQSVRLNGQPAMLNQLDKAGLHWEVLPNAQSLGKSYPLAAGIQTLEIVTSQSNFETFQVSRATPLPLWLWSLLPALITLVLAGAIATGLQATTQLFRLKIED